MQPRKVERIEGEEDLKWLEDGRMGGQCNEYWPQYKPHTGKLTNTLQVSSLENCDQPKSCINLPRHNNLQ